MKRNSTIPRRRWLGLAFAVYLLAGFVTNRVAWVPGTEARVARAALPDEPGVVVRGVSSVHTTRSHDAEGTIYDVAEAARRAGLDFVLIGDHPTRDSTRVGAAVVDSVLLAFGDEIVIEETGRVLLFGLPQSVGPRAWAFEGVERLVEEEGATAAVIHSRSPNGRGRWLVESTAPASAWEVMDVSESARRALTSPWVGYHAVALVLGALTGRLDAALLGLDRGGFEVPSVAAYDSATARGPLTAIGGLNHHPKVRLFGTPLPSYVPFFRTLVNHVRLDRPLPPDPAEAMAHLQAAIEAGAVHFATGSDDAAARFRFAAVDRAGRAASMGDATMLRPGLILRTNRLRPRDGRLLFRVVRDGRQIARIRAPALEYPVPAPGVYRVEVFRYSARFGDLFLGLRPWIFSNPIRVTAS